MSNTAFSKFGRLGKKRQRGEIVRLELGYIAMSGLLDNEDALGILDGEPIYQHEDKNCLRYSVPAEKACRDQVEIVHPREYAKRT